MNICQLKDVVKNVPAAARTTPKEEFQKCFKHGNIFAITVSSKGTTLKEKYLDGSVLIYLLVRLVRLLCSHKSY